MIKNTRAVENGQLTAEKSAGNRKESYGMKKEGEIT